MFKHRPQNLLFRGNSALALSSSNLNSLLIPRFRFIDIAGLTQLIISRFGSGSYSKVVSSLVNVCSPFSKFSTGFLEVPPEKARPLNSHILFTFGIKYDLSWDTSSLQVNTTSIRSCTWGSDEDPRRFITIGITSVEAAEFGLLHVQSNELNYLYRILGIIFRSIFMHYTAGMLSNLKRGETILSFTSESKNVFFYKDLCLEQPLSGIVRLPYHTWQFNKHIWADAPNLIPYSTVEPQLALYYFMFILNSNITSSNDTTKILDIGISKVLSKSLLSFIQYLKTGSDYQFELVDLIAPNILASLMYTGHSTFTLNRASYLVDLKETTVAFADQLKKFVSIETISQSFLPIDRTVRAMLSNDSSIVNNLLTTRIN